MKMRLNKTVTFILALCLSALLLISCDAPGVKLLEDLLPPLTEKTTGYTVTESIVVTQMTTALSVEFSTPAEMEAFHQRLEGVKCVRDKEQAGEFLLYSITFFTKDSAETFYVVSDDVFVFDGYRYDIMRGGLDTVYLASLFPAPLTPEEVEEAASVEP